MARILIADDMAVIREPIAMALERAGHETLVASSGAEAVGIVRRERPDLLLLDIHMPGMSGIDALLRIRDDASVRDIPVILLTDVSERKTVLQAIELGVRHYLLKSAFSVEELHRRVDVALQDHAGVAEAAAGELDDGELDAGRSMPTGNDRVSVQEADSADSRDCAPDDPEGALKARKPILRRSELAEQVEGCELKAMSPTVAEVLKLANDPKASIERIGKAIRRDQAVAVKILRLANSAAYASSEPVDAVDKAVIRIGLKAIGQAVMNIAVVDQFSANANGVGIDARLFWEHSIGCGIIAARIAGAVGCASSDTAFTMGLIHDVGRFVYADMLGEQYEAVLSVASELQLPLEQVEKRLLLLNHADGMDRILHQWKFPRDLIDPIVFHHLSLGNIRRIAPKRLPEVATLALANRIAHALMLGSSGNESVYSTHEFCEALKIDAQLIHEIEMSVHDETDDLKFAMLTSGTTDRWPDLRSRAQEHLGVPFRPVFVSMRPEIDAYRIFCDQLAERTGEPPNISIVHLTDKRERVPLSAVLRQAESQMGTRNLPLVILSPNGRLRVEQGVLADRRYECLSTPLAVIRLLTTFRRLLEEAVSANAA